MVLAEALLRVPDAATADRLIEDKLGQGDFAHHEAKSDAFLVTPPPGRSASRRASSSRARRRKASSASSPSASACRRCARRRGRPCASSATISCSARPSRRRWTARARPRGGSTAIPSTCSARARARPTTPSATFESYAAAIEAIGRSAGNEPLPNRPGISVKLSALHPRYEAVSRERVMRELVPRVVDLAAQGQVLRPQLHHRCRGGGPARTLARRHRRRRSPIRRSRLGRLRPRHPGLPEARRRGDRPHRRARRARSTGA